MPRRTQLFRIMPWTGGVNTSVDPGVLNPQELVQADNVQFSSTGARIKRNALEYLLNSIPAPDFRSSSGTTRTLKWTTNALVNIANPNQRLVAGERITITGVSNYSVTDVAISAVTSIPQVTSVVCAADSGGSLNNKYFLISAGDDGVDYYVWYNVNSAGVDPLVGGRTGIEVAIATNTSANDVATATAAAIDSETDFAASAATATVTITNAVGGLTGDSGAGNSGFTVTDTTKGGHTITYTGGSSLSESSTSAGSIVIVRASKVISYTDYWRFATDQTNTQLGVFATDDFQLFYHNDSGNRVQIHGQPQVTSIVCAAGSTLTSGDYFTLNSANNATNYYVWYNVDAGGGDPAPSGKTGIEVAVSAGDTDAQVATATKNAIDAVSGLTASVNTATVTVTLDNAGITTEAADVNTGFVITTTSSGATAPTSAVSAIRTLVFQEKLFLCFTGLGNLPIYWNPDDNAKYQLLDDAPDTEFMFEHLGRIWANDKENRSRLHFCETFDYTLWQGFGDSGAIDIAPGDGDPEGIINAYKYKGMIIVGKKSCRYRIVGDSPENFGRELISSGLGNEGAFSIPVDESDVVFISRRGVHSQQATDTFGDIDSAYLSRDIKPTFNDWEAEQLKYSQGAYIPELNSIAFSVVENGQNVQSDVWLYNFEAQVDGKDRPGAWYRWPDISCTALSRRFVGGKYKLVFGTNDGQIVQAQNEGNFSDFDEDGIPFTIKTGKLYPGNDPQSMKAFRKITMFYRPKGNFTFTVKAWIDNGIAQAFSFNQISGLDELGEDFILGSSLLGSSADLAPFTFSMDGYGRGVTLEVTQPTANEQVEIWGFAIEWESADLMQATDEE